MQTSPDRPRISRTLTEALALHLQAEGEAGRAQRLALADRLARLEQSGGARFVLDFADCQHAALAKQSTEERLALGFSRDIEAGAPRARRWHPDAPGVPPSRW